MDEVIPDEIGFPTGHADERELLLHWLRYLRGSVLRNVDGIDDAQARWTPNGKLISLLGIVNHLTHVEYRWIEGGFHGAAVSRSEKEFTPGPELSLASAVAAYRARGDATEAAVRALPLTRTSPASSWAEGNDLRFVLLHLVNETARHAGHADATRELLDGTTGE
jgi:uncharacterized damage-inducible protein DinB